MPKSIVVDPRETRKPGTLSFTDIPLNAYVPDMKRELKAHGKDALVRAYRDIFLEGRAPAPGALWKFWAVSLLLFFAGHAWFYRLRKTFADVI